MKLVFKIILNFDFVLHTTCRMTHLLSELQILTNILLFISAFN